MEQFTREEMLIGSNGVETLQSKCVAVFGLGGVGGYAVEALCRAGIGKLVLVDGDIVSESNINRQLYALHSTIGKTKCSVAENRCKDINPNAVIEAKEMYFSQDTLACFDFHSYDYVIDAVDSVTAKILLAEKCKECGTPIISSMGTGNKFDAEKLTIADIYETSVCPLAKVMRHELRERNIEKLKVVYSTEEPTKTNERTPGSMSFVPPVAGMLLAGEVIKHFLNK